MRILLAEDLLSRRGMASVRGQCKPAARHSEYFHEFIATNLTAMHIWDDSCAGRENKKHRIEHCLDGGLYRTLRVMLITGLRYYFSIHSDPKNSIRFRCFGCLRYLSCASFVRICI